MYKLTVKEFHRYLVIKEYAKGKISRKQAAVKLAVTTDTISVLKTKYMGLGRPGFSHKNHGNRNARRVSSEIELKIVDLYKANYLGFNFSHFYEMITLSQPPLDFALPTERTVFRILSRHKITSPQANRRKREPNQHPVRPRRISFGELVQLDASLHDWFSNGIKATLHLAVDDATSRVLSGYFEPTETLHGYYVITAQILRDYGIPGIFYTDKRTVFEFMSGKRKQAEHIQFKQACSQLGIEIITTSVAQAKGRVERSFRTHQDRLVAEFKLTGITTIAEANKYLQSYIVRHNQKFGLPLNANNAFKTLDRSTNINRVLCVSTLRSILNGNVISFCNQQLMPVHDDGRPLILTISTEVNVIQTLDNKTLIKHQDKYYRVVKMADGRLTSHTPPKNHPWRSKYITKKK